MDTSPFTLYWLWMAMMWYINWMPSSHMVSSIDCLACILHDHLRVAPRPSKSGCRKLHVTLPLIESPNNVATFELPTIHTLSLGQPTARYAVNPTLYHGDFWTRQGQWAQIHVGQITDSSSFSSSKNVKVSGICDAWFSLSYGYSRLYANATIKIASNMAMRMCIKLVMGRSVGVGWVVSTLIEGQAILEATLNSLFNVGDKKLVWKCLTWATLTF